MADGGLTYEVEGAVDLVKLCAEDGGEEVGHLEKSVAGVGLARSKSSGYPGTESVVMRRSWESYD